MATSFNFGEVVSVIIASIVLPFLPETPIQLLVEGLLYDFGQMTIPFDNVDKELIRKPKKLNIKSQSLEMVQMELTVQRNNHKFYNLSVANTTLLLSMPANSD